MCFRNNLCNAYPVIIKPHHDGGLIHPSADIAHSKTRPSIVSSVSEVTSPQYVVFVFVQHLQHLAGNVRCHVTSLEPLIWHNMSVMVTADMSPTWLKCQQQILANNMSCHSVMLKMYPLFNVSMGVYYCCDNWHFTYICFMDGMVAFNVQKVHWDLFYQVPHNMYAQRIAQLTSNTHITHGWPCPTHDSATHKSVFNTDDRVWCTDISHDCNTIICMTAAA